MILAVDVGKGTEDILLINEDRIENSIQAILPSTAQSLTKKLKNDPNSTLVFSGDTIAGEPWHRVVYDRIEEKKHKVIMTHTAARSLRYNLDQVRARGISIVNDTEIDTSVGSHYYLEDVNWMRIFSMIKESDYAPEDITKVLLCCQDHGEPKDPNQSTRDFRMKSIYEPLRKRGNLSDLLQNMKSVPDILPRHQSICQSALRHFSHLNENDIYVMDSSPAVVLGAQDTSKEEIVVNVGNGHTLAVFLDHGYVQAVYETHTGAIRSPEKFYQEIKQVGFGNLTHKQVLDRGGHGLFLNTKVDLSHEAFSEIEPIVVIGPNRDILSGLPVRFSHPIGSMMMAGPYGLYLAYKEHA